VQDTILDPVADARDTDLQAEREVRRLLAPILQANDEFDMVALGRIAQDKKCHRPLSPQDQAIWDWFASNGGGYCLVAAAHQYEAHLEQRVRHLGGTIVTTTTRNGRTTTTRRTYPAPRIALAPARARSCSRAARPRERRAAASSTTSGTDPGQDDGPSHQPPPPLTLWRHPRYGATSPALLRVLLAVERVSP